MLGRVFPQAKLKFDPHEKSVSKDSHMKKKKYTPKCSSITIVLLKNFQLFLPKGDARKKLTDEDRIKTVSLNRKMTPKQVKSVIIRAFQIKDFIVLDVAKGSRLVKSDGNCLTAQSAIDRRGAVYLCQKESEMVCFD
jgi:hypothetical protein